MFLARVKEQCLINAFVGGVLAAKEVLSMSNNRG